MDWNKLKEDVAKGVKEGLDVIKEGAGIAAKKAGQLTSEGQRRLKIYGIKKDIHNTAADLGAMLYRLEKEKSGVIKDIMALELVQKIDKLEAELKNAEK